jgi:N-acetylmuramoyl-L-alanine amidase
MARWLIACGLCLAAALSSARNLPVVEVARTHGLVASPERNRRITLSGADVSLVLETNSRRLFHDGLLVYLNSPLIPERGRWSLTETDARVVVGPLLQRERGLTLRRCDLVMLDPGHGGADPGTIGKQGVEEKMIVLDLAKRVAAKLEACDIRACLTRDRDSTLDLDSRSWLAVKRRADLFVSIHVNYSPDRTASGFETYALTSPGFPSTSSSEARKSDARVCAGNRYDPANLVAGYYIQKGLLVCSGGEDRGLRRARFQVLRDAPCPAVLVECGFLSCAADEEKLLRKASRDTIAEGIARGILTYACGANAALPAPPP